MAQLLLLLFAMASWAGEDPSTPPDQPLFFETATVRERPVGTATTALDVMRTEEVEALAARDLAESLRLIPGLHLSGSASRGGLFAAQVRGGDPNFTLVLLDGVPLNDSTDQLGGAFHLPSLPVLELEQIEVVRGPVSSTYGSAALSGAIQLITARSSPRHVSIDLESGGTDYRAAGASGAAQLGRQRSPLHLQASLSAVDEEHQFGDDDYSGSAGRLAVDGSFLEEALSWRAFVRGTDWRGDDYTQGSGGPELGSGELRHSEHDELVVGHLLDWRLGKADYQFRASLYRHRLDRSSPAIFPVVPPVVEATELEAIRFASSRSQELGERLRLSVGLEGVEDRGHNQSLLLLPPAFGGATSGDYDERRRLLAPYGEIVLTTGQTTFEAGLRLDLPENQGHETSPRLGLAHRFGNSGFRFRTTVGRAFKLPSLFALASPRALGGNPELEPETSTSGDAELEYRSSTDTTRLRIAVFQSEFRDLIDFDFEVFQLRNLNRARARGVEVTAAFRPREDLRLGFSYDRTEATDRSSGEDLLRRPQATASANVAWRPGPWLVAVETTYTGKQRDIQIPVVRNVIEPYWLWGLTTAFEHGRYRLRLRIDNALDRDYESLIGFRGPRRQLRLSLRYRFGKS